MRNNNAESWDGERRHILLRLEPPVHPAFCLWSLLPPTVLWLSGLKSILHWAPAAVTTAVG